MLDTRTVKKWSDYMLKRYFTNGSINHTQRKARTEKLAYYSLRTWKRGGKAAFILISDSRLS